MEEKIKKSLKPQKTNKSQPKSQENSASQAVKHKKGFWSFLGLGNQDNSKLKTQSSKQSKPTKNQKSNNSEQPKILSMKSKPPTPPPEPPKKSIDQLVREIAEEMETKERKEGKIAQSQTATPEVEKPTPKKMDITAATHPSASPSITAPPITKTPPEKPSPLKSKVTYVDLSKVTVSKEVLSKIPEYIARLYQTVPIGLEGEKLVVAMVDPQDYQAIEFIRKKTGYEIEPKLAKSEDITRLIDQYSGLEAEIKKVIKGTEFAKKAPEVKKEVKEEKITAQAPTIRVVQSILKKAVASRASDIHIEPEENQMVVRFRIDGVLQRVITLPKEIQAAIISRIKILSNLKIDEQRLPQDGRFEMNIHNRDIDFRVSTFPSINGEKVVMRILDKNTAILTFDQLGLAGRAFKILDEGIHKAHGMTLVTGPTGSGKTTTLYAIIGRLHNVGVNIVTLEDPIEYQIKGINQAQVRPDIGFTFANGLRSIVRQDPDIIMVGEIRDLETAEMAVHAALTGHVVLSTLHTNDAAGAIPRLIDMGVEPFLIASSVNTVVAQRLARKICEQCRQKINLPPEVLTEVKKELTFLPKPEKDQLSKKPLVFYQGKGCPACNKTGYKGRIGIFEILANSENIKTLTIKKSSATQIKQMAISEGMVTMKQDGILKAISGVTTIEEVWRVTKE